MSPAEPSPSVPVAIIGMACIFPRSDDLAGYWETLRQGRDAITEVPATHWRPDDYFDPDPKSPDRTYARRGGFLDPVDFPPLDFGIAPNNLEATDTTQLLGLLVARQALEDAGYGAGSTKPFDRSRVSVILGVTGTLELVIPLGARLGHPVWRRALMASGVPEAQAEEVVRRIADSYVPWQENSFPGLLGNVAAGRIANRLDLHGTNCVVDAACASSVAAMNLALLELATGRCDVALSGGLDTFNDIFMYMCFSKTPALSPRGDARPFDAGADGTVLGEGLGVVVLKRLDDARRDGDKVYAVIRAVGAASDGKGGAVYAPAAAGQARALRQAYRLAGVSPSTVGMVEAHGTGTKVGDATELAALQEVFREASPDGTWCALGSVKSQIGHTKAAAGAAGIIKAALALHHKVLPPTIKVETPADGLGPGRSPFYVNTRPRPWLPRTGHPRRAAVSAFGFGGSNYHCVLEEADPAHPGVAWDGSVQIFAASAPNREALAAALDGPAWEGDWSAFRAEARRSRAAFRHDAPHRLLLVVDRSTDRPALRKTAREVLTAHAGRPREGVHHGSGRPPGSLAFLFPGQGSQYVGMLRELACVFPDVQEALADAEALTPAGGVPLGDRIFPLSEFTEAECAENEAALRATDAAQPAIGAVSLGAARLLTRFGVVPAAVAGHSFGELTALCSAGWLDPEAFAALAAERGRLMAAEAARGGGSMLAVLAPLGVVEEVVAAEGLGETLVVANKNGPRQFVLSGPVDAVEQAARAFERRGVTARPLAVSAAFHSPAVASASGPFLDAVRQAALSPTSKPVFANATARPYPKNADEARDLLAGQLARPVEFAAMVEAMADSGVATFLEVGPDSKLTGLVRSILDTPGKRVRALALDAGRGARGNLGDLASVLAELAAIGYPVDLARWDEGAPAPSRPASRPALTVKISGANLTPRPSSKDEPAGPQSPPQPRPATSPTASAPPAAPTEPASHTAPPPVASPPMTPTPPPPPRSPSTPAPSPARLQAPGPDDRHAAGRNGSKPAAPTLANGHAPSNGSTPHPAPAVTAGADATLLAEALRNAQDNLLALQRLGEQTANLHRQFLDGQERAHRTFQTLLEQQQSLFTAGLPLRTTAPAETATPAPVEPPKRQAPEPVAPVAVRPAAPVAKEEGRAAAPSAPPVSQPTPRAVAVAPAPPRPEPVKPAPVVVAKAPATDRVLPVLLSVVSEKTGYPAEMLDPSMQLDADLGIDSIKRVEILSALQERLPDAPAARPEHLGTLRTLADIAEFLGAGAGPGPAASPTPEVAPVAAAALSPTVLPVLLSVVSEKTGYPAEMLDPSMQLDADLGIDSIKRVEILSALQERLPDAPAARPEHLGTLRTLADIAEFLGAGAETATVAAVPAVMDSAPATESVLPVLLSVVSEKTGYPAEMLDPSMQLDADLGIDSIKRVEILSALQERLPDAPAARPEHLGTLRTLADIAEFLAAGTPRAQVAVETPAPVSPSSAPTPVASGVQRLVVRSESLHATETGPCAGLAAGSEVWLLDDGQGLAPAVAALLRRDGCRPRVIARGEVSGLGAPEALGGLVLLAPTSGEGDALVKDAFRLLRLAGPALRRAPGAVVCSVSRLDGAFGTHELPADCEPTTGGLAGLVKTARHEWPGVGCKAVDLASELGQGDEAASALVEELRRAGPVEVGLSPSGRSTLVLTPVPLGGTRAGSAPRLQPGDVIVVTGGARGVTAEVARALAAEFRPRLVLLGRSPAPEDEPEWLLPLHDEAQIKRALASRANGHATPHLIGEQCRRVVANREIRHNLDRIRAAGGEVVYRQVDVRRAGDVRSVLDAVRREFGPVRGLVHGAGVLADRRIEDKTDEQFDHVYDTKVAGLKTLLHALAPDDLRLMVFFSSSTARFGRTGQVAYAAANEVLNKLAQREARERPGCRVVSVNWGPWDGGMVTPQLRSLFESEGIGLIPPGEGARYLVEELCSAADRAVEVVILGGDSLPDALAPPRSAAPAVESMPRPATTEKLRLVFDRELSLESLPVLRSHVIDGRGVLPMALMVEWMAHGAVQRNPGLVLHGLEDVRLLKGAVLHDDRPETLSVSVGRAERDGGVYRVPVEVGGTATGGRPVTHARGLVVLGDRDAAPAPFDLPHGLPAYGRSLRSVYHDVLFHGPLLQGVEAVEGLGAGGLVAVVKTRPEPSSWVHRPLRQGWLVDPLALDCAFQLLSLWSFERAGAPSLPTRVGHYRQFAREFPAVRVRVAATVRQPSEHRATADILFLDESGRLVARLDDYECVIDGSLTQAFRRNRLARHSAAPTPR